ncbi:pentatricopeptide repeat-containing protein 2, mitochondrial [Bombus vancouverensis nearcticus]|uniref:pentatricopeptide repeat-containing protein 2, mitochondrial n=1 Tax=Bombus vancouverensis nearcticus TaxID=2705178 RepID=UPI001439E77C|nr:pentatricopeptide repeat-containing protein 2, mitochondrial-like [Bombus vancouverensis nearcticus]
MATNLRGLCRLNISLANNAFFKYNFINVGVRCMYTERDLGVASYENTRYVFRNQFMTIENTFREKMQEICQDQNGVVYTEDLKAMIHLAQANESDMQLLNNMLEKYIQKQEEKKFGKYVFGPVVMRMYYHLNQPEYALEAFDNNTLKESFDYRTSFRILMCLLYKNGMYKKMREVYQKVLDKNGIDYIGSSNVLMYAGCLKENTPEALEYALDHWKQQYDKMKPSIRSCSLLSCLAIKNNKPEIALDILSTIPLDRIMSVKGLKILAYMHLGRYIQIIPILKYGLEQDNAHVKSNYFFADVMYELEEKLKAENVEESKQLLNLIEQARKQDFIQTNYTLEEFILRPMMFRSRNKGASENMDDKKRFRNRQQYQSQQNELKNYL